MKIFIKLNPSRKSLIGSLNLLTNKFTSVFRKKNNLEICFERSCEGSLGSDVIFFHPNQIPK